MRPKKDKPNQTPKDLSKSSPKNSPKVSPKGIPHSQVQTASSLAKMNESEDAALMALAKERALNKKLREEIKKLNDSLEFLSKKPVATSPKLGSSTAISQGDRNSALDLKALVDPGDLIMPIQDSESSSTPPDKSGSESDENQRISAEPSITISPLQIEEKGETARKQIIFVTTSETDSGTEDSKKIGTNSKEQESQTEHGVFSDLQPPASISADPDLSSLAGRLNADDISILQELNPGSIFDLMDLVEHLQNENASLTELLSQNLAPNPEESGPSSQQNSTATAQSPSTSRHQEASPRQWISPTSPRTPAIMAATNLVDSVLRRRVYPHLKPVMATQKALDAVTNLNQSLQRQIDEQMPKLQQKIRTLSEENANLLLTSELRDSQNSDLTKENHRLKAASKEKELTEKLAETIRDKESILTELKDRNEAVEKMSAMFDEKDSQIQNLENQHEFLKKTFETLTTDNDSYKKQLIEKESELAK